MRWLMTVKRGPAQPGGAGQRHAERVERAADLRRQQQDADGRESDPGEVPAAARGRDRQPQRPDELDCDRDAEWDPRDGPVEAQVHDGQDRSVDNAIQRPRALRSIHRRVAGDEQHGGEGQAQEGRARRAQAPERG